MSGRRGRELEGELHALSASGGEVERALDVSEIERRRAEKVRVRVRVRVRVGFL